MNITVAGMGYVGLSLAVLLARHEHVTVTDIIPEKVDMLNRGVSPIRDEYIERYLKEAAEGKRSLDLKAVTGGAKAYAGADIVVAAVPTNYDPSRDHFDCSAVEAVIEQALCAAPDAYIVIRSTVPVGYTASVRERYGSGRILFSPEFLRESKALYDNLYPGRIIVGCDGGTRAAAETFAGLLKKAALKENVDTLFMGFTEAEAVKLFANAYLALRVGFFNELDTYAEVNGLDSRAIIEGVGLDPRIGPHYNNPSFGYGGYCLPKDTRQLLANYAGIPQRIIAAAVESNEVRMDHVAEEAARLCRKAAEDDFPGKEPVAGIFRLAMKSGSDNFRESAVLHVADRLREDGIRVIVYEPSAVDGSVVCGYTVVNDLAEFKRLSCCILANRYDHLLDDVKDKVYTRDIFNRD
ncbi:MAG: nucleotide sugar dehydrogenase [Firmicutes bacterium]|nr:nucleotide sugar dehydrogenase [Bacillota bacterium]